MRLTRKSLIDLANYLDESGLIKEADQVDSLIKKADPTFDYGDQVDVLWYNNMWYAGTVVGVNDRTFPQSDRYLVRWRRPRGRSGNRRSDWVDQRRVSRPGEYNTDSTWLQSAEEAVQVAADQYSEHGVAQTVATAVEEWNTAPWVKVLILDLVGLIPAFGTLADTTQMLVGYQGMLDAGSSLGRPYSENDMEYLRSCADTPNPDNCAFLSNLLRFVRSALITLAGLWFVVSDVASMIAASATGGAAYIATEVVNIAQEATVKALKWAATSSLSWSAAAVAASGWLLAAREIFAAADSLLLSEEEVQIAINDPNQNPEKKYAETTGFMAAAAIAPGIPFLATPNAYTVFKNSVLGSLTLLSSASDDLNWTAGVNDYV